MANITLGSISHGTLRTRDLIAAFLFALEDIDQKEATRVTSNAIAAGWPYSQSGLGIGQEEDWTEDMRDYADFLLEDLMEALESLAPDYTYFGANEGDGSDFGFWPAWDAIDEDRRSGALPDASLSDDEGFENFHTFIGASDHGNVGIYHRAEDGSLVEVWSVV